MLRLDVVARRILLLGTIGAALVACTAKDDFSSKNDPSSASTIGAKRKAAESSSPPDTPAGVISFPLAVQGDCSHASGTPVLRQGSKVIVVAHIQDGSPLNTAVMRFDENGVIDSTFGAAGVVKIGAVTGNIVLPGLSGDFCSGAVQADNKIVLTGTTNAATGTDPTHVRVLRLLPNGQLDSAFGTDGLFELSHQDFLANYESYVPSYIQSVPHQIAVDMNQRIVVTGYVRGFTKPAYPLVVRLLPSGALDTSFGTNGTLLLDPNAFNSWNGWFDAILPLNDGRILVGGCLGWYCGSYTSDAFVARLSSQGSLDTAFGAGGIRRLPFPSAVDPSQEAPGNKSTRRLLTDASGSILAVGSYSFAYPLSTVYRLSASGNLDLSFANGLSYGLASVASANQWTNRIQLVGTTVVQYYDDYAGVVRLNADGSPDTLFNTADTSYPSSPSMRTWRLISGGMFCGEPPNGAIFQPDGKVVVVGSYACGNPTTYAGIYFLRFNTDGSIDETFGTDTRPDRPTKLRATIGHLQVNLTWEPSPNTTQDGFKIYVADCSSRAEIGCQPIGIADTPTVPYPQTDFAVQTFSDGSTVDPSKLYKFTVTAVKGGAESDPSEPIFAGAFDRNLEPGFVVPAHLEEPVLLVHGIWSSAATWTEPGKLKSFLEGSLGWKFGGELRSTGSDYLTAVAQPGFDAQGDFFAVTFGNDEGNYPSGPIDGIHHQNLEIGKFIAKRATLDTSRSLKKLVILAHSMGGLASADFISDNPAAPVSRLITYGTPFRGSGWSVLFASRSQGFLDMTFSCLTLITTRLSPFLDALRTKQLPNIPYVSIIGDAAAESDLTCLDRSPRGDLIVSMDSANLAEAKGTQPLQFRKLVSDKWHWSQTADVSTILCALDEQCKAITVRSPVEVEVSAPSGRRISRLISEIPGASYQEIVEENGHQIAQILLPFALPGNYSIKVTAKAGAQPADTYTIVITQGASSRVLVQDQPVSAIPSAPYAVNLPASNLPPRSNAGADRTVRQGSYVTLDGSASGDPDNGPVALRYSWRSLADPVVSLINPGAVRAAFNAGAPGTFTFGLTVDDGAAKSAESLVSIVVPRLGDIDGDDDVDSDDLAKINAALNTNASGPNDLRDLDGDGRITALDARKLVTLCTRPRCAK